MIMKKCCGVHGLRIAVGILVLGLLLAGSANAAKTITVCHSGCDYSSIQKAIKASSNGDTILVYSGIYHENVNITKQLTLHGIGNPVVDAGGSGSVITLSADGIILEGFTATESGYLEAGIKVTSSNNTLNGNNASNNYYTGIYLDSSSNSNTLSGNNASNNSHNGIYLQDSSYNTLSGNNASNNRNDGISLTSSSSNTLNINIASNNIYGIRLDDSSYNTISNNNELSNSVGLSLVVSGKNILTNNVMTGNIHNFELWGDFEHNQIDKTNLVNGKPIYYIKNSVNTIYDHATNAGTFYCINCINVTIQDMNLSANDAGIFFWKTTHSRIQNVNVSNNNNGFYLGSSSNNTLSNNTLSNNYDGIFLSSSSYNTMTGNNASNNGDGIHLSHSSNNKIYNNIFNNTNNFYISDLNINSWNTTRQSGTNIIGGPYLGGNFWANPNGTGFSQTCKDGNGDGICDQSHILDSNNIDYLPLSMNFTKDNIPPKSVRKLNTVSYTSSYINWKWNDPKNSDFYKVQIYINNKYKTSVLKGVQHYKAKNLYANRSYTISTRTVDASGNVNLTWKNNTAWTRHDLVPPMNVTNLKNITYAKNYINWTWKDPKDTDFKKVMVFIDGNFKGNVSKGKRYYNATNFSANKRYTISTWTVDMNGNINKTWTNSSAWTSK